MGLGIKCKTYVELTEDVFTEIKAINEEQLNSAFDEADATTRGSPVDEVEPTRLKLDATLKVKHDPTSPVWQYLLQQHLSRGACTLMFLSSGAVSHANGVFDVANTANDTVGFRYNGKVLSFSEARNLGDVEFNDLTVKPCSDSEAVFVRVDAGSLTPTAIGSTISFA